MELLPNEKMTLNLRVNSKRDIPSTPSTITTSPRESKRKVKGAPTTEGFMELLHQVKQIEEIKAIQHKTTTTWEEYVKYQWTDGFLQPLLIWCIWLFVGTMYFSNMDFDGNYAQGFYYSISVGYCLGWGVLTLSYKWSKVFAIFYLFVGALFVLHYVTELIQLAVAENDNTYEQLKIKRNIERSCSLKGWQKKVYVYMAMHNEKLFMIYVWVIFIFIGAFYSVAAVRWPWMDGFYFSITTLATAGLFGIPKGSPDYLFVVTGLFTAVGVPTMAMAVSNIGLLIMEARAEARVEAIINQELQVTKNEIEDVLRLKEHNQKLNLKPTSHRCSIHTTIQQDSNKKTTDTNNGNAGEGKEISIDKNEFLIVSLIRMKIIDIELIHDVLIKFDRVDAKREGKVDLALFKDHFHSDIVGKEGSTHSSVVDERHVIKGLTNSGGEGEKKSSDSLVYSSIRDAESPFITDTHYETSVGAAGGVDESVVLVDTSIDSSGAVTKDGYQYLEDV